MTSEYVNFLVFKGQNFDLISKLVNFFSFLKVSILVKRSKFDLNMVFKGQIFGLMSKFVDFSVSKGQNFG